MNVRVSDPRGLYFVSIIFFIVGFVLLCVAGFLTWRTSRFTERAQSTTGTVTALVPDHNSNGKTTYAPVFSFKAADGKTYSITSSASNNPPAFNVNDDVTVLYDPSNPSGARIDSTFQLWGAPMILGSVGAFMVAMASVFTLTLRRLAGGALPRSATR
jgi:hypothetical protein